MNRNISVIAMECFSCPKAGEKDFQRLTADIPEATIRAYTGRIGIVRCAECASA